MTQHCFNCGCPLPPPGRLTVTGVGEFADTEGVEEVLAAWRKSWWHAQIVGVAGMAIAVVIAMAALSACVSAPEVASVAEPLPVVRDCAPGFVAAPEPVWTAPATAVIDGDSFCLGEVEIRIARYSAPEWDQPGGAEARDRTGGILAGGNPLTCTSRARSYDRVVADCLLADGRDLAKTLKGGEQ